MPWCPNCKNEYKEGITVCSDCGAELVDSLEALEQPEPVKYMFGTREEMEPLYDFLKFGGLSYIEIKYENEADETESYYIEIDKKEQDRAVELTAIFYKELRKKDAAADAGNAEEAGFENFDTEEASDETEKKAEPVPAVFVKASDKAENYRSSAYALLAVGILGVLAIILIAVGVIPLNIASNIKVISFITMMLLFVIFIVMGAKAFADAKKYEAMAKQEEEATEGMQTWFLGTYTKQSLDDAAGISEGSELAEEVLYFKRSAFIRQKLTEQFGELEPSYLEKNVEDLYTEIYEH